MLLKLNIKLSASKVRFSKISFSDLMFWSKLVKSFA